MLSTVLQKQKLGCIAVPSQEARCAESYSLGAVQATSGPSLERLQVLDGLEGGRPLLPGDLRVLQAPWSVQRQRGGCRAQGSLGWEADSLHPPSTNSPDCSSRSSRGVKVAGFKFFPCYPMACVGTDSDLLRLWKGGGARGLRGLGWGEIDSWCSQKVPTVTEKTVPAP